MLEKCVLTILELNGNQRLGHKKTKLNLCHHMLTSSTQLQKRSFHVVEGTRTSSKCQKMKNAKMLFFIVKYANLWGFLLPSSSWLLKLPIILFRRHASAKFQEAISVLKQNLEIFLALLISEVCCL